jgi:hypothetical protein
LYSKTCYDETVTCTEDVHNVTRVTRVRRQQRRYVQQCCLSCPSIPSLSATCYSVPVGSVDRLARTPTPSAAGGRGDLACGVRASAAHTLGVRDA